MTPQEAHDKLVNQATTDLLELRGLLEAYRREKGIPMGQFIELIASVSQEYRLIRQYITIKG